MAREMALAGVDRSELTPPPPPQTPKGFANKLSNFWYHYKWHVIAACFIVGLAVWFLVDFLTEETYDYSIVVVTEEPLGEIWTAELKSYVAACADDRDGDGTVEIDIENLSPYYYTEYAPTLGKADADRLQTVLASGEVMLFVFDASCYEQFTQTFAESDTESFVFFKPIETDSASYDAQKHAWNWCDDQRRLEYDLANLPDDMYFGVRKPTGTAGGDDAAELAKEGVALIKRLIESAKY